MTTHVTIEPACFRDASYIVANMRPGDRDEIMCQVPLGTKSYEIAKFMIEGGDAYVAYWKGTPVMLFGTNPLNSAVMCIWAIGTKHTWRVIHAVSRFMMNVHLPAQVETHGYKAMEARSHITHEAAHRWMQSTGAVVWGPPFVYGMNGEKFLMFRWEPEAFAAARAKYGTEPK